MSGFLLAFCPGGGGGGGGGAKRDGMEEILDVHLCLRMQHLFVCYNYTV